MRFLRSLFVAIGLLVAVPAFASVTFMGANDFAHYSPAEIQQFKQGNVTFTRLEVNWPRLNPSPDVYNWSETDEQFAAAEKAGFKIYADFMWAPRHATGGIPSYEEYTNGCTVFDTSTTVTFFIGGSSVPDLSQPLNVNWARKDMFVVPRGGTITIPAPGVLGNDGDYGKGLASVVKTVGQRTPLEHGSFILNFDGSLTYTNDGTGEIDKFAYFVWGLPDGGIHFARDDYDYCKVPSHIDPAKVRKFVKAFVDRYGKRIDYYGIWNEPGMDVYWPAQIPDGPWMVGDYHRFVEEFVKPAVETVRMFDPSAKIVGPECESSGCIRGVLGIEKAQNARWFDIVSFHPYPWNDDFIRVGSNDLWAEAATSRIDLDFKPAIDQYVAGRPVWASEVSPPTSNPKHVEWALGLTKAIYGRPWISVIGGLSHTLWQNESFFSFAKSTNTPIRRRVVRQIIFERFP